MPTDIALTRHFAAADRRIESMSLLCEMFSGHVKKQRQELQEIKWAIASTGGHEQSGQVAPGDIEATMLEG